MAVENHTVSLTAKELPAYHKWEAVSENNPMAGR